MAHPYLPVGDEVLSLANGSALALIPAGAINAYTQTYSTAATTVPDATFVDVTASITAVAPAGGTGADAGCWSSAADRDIAITTTNETKTLLESEKVQHTALTADVLALKKVLTALIDDLQGWGIIT